MAKARTKSERPWVDMDTVRVRKPIRRIVDHPTREQIIAERKSAVKTLVIHREDALRGGAKRFGAVDCIYFVRMVGTDAYKIGYTFHLRQRVSALGAGVPVPVHCVSWVSFFDDEMLGEAEARAHELAGMYGERLKGEWFNLQEKDVRRIVDHLIEGMRDDVMGASFDGGFDR